ncbi:hypothetical protein KM043_007235 [Ampulex compressa]|nr:hypothetical protein KM043_007235 [Ampulex compressa]
MPTKGKHHHLPHHHPHHSQQQQQQQQQQVHHNPQQHHQLIVNVNQPSVAHSSQAYNTVVASNTPRYVPNADFEVRTAMRPMWLCDRSEF